MFLLLPNDNLVVNDWLADDIEVKKGIKSAEHFMDGGIMMDYKHPVQRPASAPAQRLPRHVPKI